MIELRTSTLTAHLSRNPYCGIHTFSSLLTTISENRRRVIYDVHECQHMGPHLSGSPSTERRLILFTREALRFEPLDTILVFW